MSKTSRLADFFSKLSNCQLYSTDLAWKPTWTSSVPFPWWSPPYPESWKSWWNPTWPAAHTKMAAPLRLKTQGNPKVNMSQTLAEKCRLFFLSLRCQVFCHEHGTQHIEK